MLFPDKLITTNLLGSIDINDLNKFKTPTPYSSRNAMAFGSPSQVKGFEDIFVQDDMITPMKKSKVRVKVNKKLGFPGSAESLTSSDLQNLKNQLAPSHESSNQTTKRNADLSLYHLNENYLNMSTKKDDLSKFMFPSKLQEEQAKPLANLTEPPKVVEEKRENALLGPWCRRTLEFEHRKESENQEKPVSPTKSYYKGNDYLDPYIVNKARNFHGNPRTQWYVPDTDIYHPAQAIIWPGPLIRNEAVFQENLTSEKQGLN